MAVKYRVYIPFKYSEYDKIPFLFLINITTYKFYHFVGSKVVFLLILVLFDSVGFDISILLSDISVH